MTKLEDLGMTTSIGCSTKFDVQLYLVAVAVRHLLLHFTRCQTSLVTKHESQIFQPPL